VNDDVQSVLDFDGGAFAVSRDKVESLVIRCDLNRGNKII